MKHTTLFLAALLFCVSCPAQENPKRPPILGIGSVSIVLSEDPAGFYTKQLRLSLAGILCAGGCISRIDVNSHQRIELMNRMQLDPVTLKPMQTNLAQVTFETADIEGLHRYLESRGIHANEILSLDPDGENPQVLLADQDGHRIGFIQFKGKDRYRRSEGQVSGHLIHAGFVVHDRAAVDRFYKDIRGSKDDQVDWVDMQVPEGTDWIEYMLSVPNDADHRLMGVKNHLALGVPDIRATEKQLLANGVTLTEEPKIGRGGKWQLNVYDPDGTRIEFMEFKPVQKPCCSEYTGPHPGPQR